MDEKILRILSALNKQAKETLKIASELYEKGSEFLVSLLFGLLGLVLILSLLLYLQFSILLVIIFGFISFFIFFLIGLVVFRTVFTPKLSQERTISQLGGETEILQAELNNLRERNKLKETNEVFLKTRLSNVKEVIIEMREIRRLATDIREEEVANELITQVYQDFVEEDKKATLLLSDKIQDDVSKTEIDTLSLKNSSEDDSNKAISANSKNKTTKKK